MFFTCRWREKRQTARQENRGGGGDGARGRGGGGSAEQTGIERTALESTVGVIYYTCSLFFTCRLKEKGQENPRGWGWGGGGVRGGIE